MEPDAYYTDPGYASPSLVPGGGWETDQYSHGFRSPYARGPELKFRPLERSKRSAGKRWTGNYPAPLPRYSPEAYGQWSPPSTYQPDPYGTWSRAPQGQDYPGGYGSMGDYTRR